MLKLPDLKQLTHEQKDELICFLFLQVQTLIEQVATLSAEVARLSAPLAKNSSNSSKPPSSDGLTKKTRSLRKSSGKKPGGQPGHKGSTLKQVMADPTHVVTHQLDVQCESCGQELSVDQATVAERRQVLDIPLSPCEVTEHRSMKLRCSCGRLHVSDFPSAVRQAVQYGPNIKALGVMLTQGQLLPFARAAQLISDLYRVSVSPGTLVAWVQEARCALQPTADQIVQGLRQTSLVHADESGLRIEGQLQWLHVVANEKLTSYSLHAKRGYEAIQAHGILPQFKGVLVHDCWAPYWQLEVEHALCNAHLLRELVYIEESTGQSWAGVMRQWLLRTNELCEASRQQGQPLTQGSVQALTLCYQDIVRQAQSQHPAQPRVPGTRGRTKQSDAFNLLARLDKYQKAVLMFIHDPTVPFTNNLAEQAIRMPKVKQKISGCFRSQEGAHSFAVIRSCLDTLRKQGHQMMEVLRRTFDQNAIVPAWC